MLLIGESVYEINERGIVFGLLRCVKIKYEWSVIILGLFFIGKDK